MYLKKLANIIYENSSIIVKPYSTNRILWQGKAKDLKNWSDINRGWYVVEILVDHSDTSEIADYNKRKIITVV